MSDLSFEQRVEGLQSYYATLEAMDPMNPDRGEAADPNLFDEFGASATSSFLNKAKGLAVKSIGSHGYNEYFEQDLEKKDLREDDEELRLLRADILAVTTGPATPESRAERTERIAEILKQVVSGKTLSLTYFDFCYGEYSKPEELKVDPAKPLFGVPGKDDPRFVYFTIHEVSGLVANSETVTAEGLQQSIGLGLLFDPKHPLIVEPVGTSAQKSTKAL